MNSYIMHFAVYTFAMVGFIAMALYIYKKSTFFSQDNTTKDFLKVENALKLSPVKTVYVIKAGEERFLIAGDSANTTMLAKLEANNIENTTITSTVEKSNVTELPTFRKLMNRINRG